MRTGESPVDVGHVNPPRQSTVLRRPPPLAATTIVVAALIGGGVLIRLAFLGADSLWLDEAFSLSAVARHTLGETWHTSLDPNHPSLYFVVLWLFVHFGGVSEAVARLPSAIASIGSLWLVFVLGRRLGMSVRAAVAAALLMAYAPLDVWYAQEARMYAMVTTAALAFAVGMATDSWRGAVLTTVALAAGLYVDFTMMPLFAIVTSLWGVRWWHSGRRIGQLVRVVVTSIAAWLMFLPEWAHLGQVLRRIDTVPLLVNVHRSTGFTIEPGVPAVAVVTLLAVGAAVAAAAVWSLLQNDRFKAVWMWVVWVGFVGLTIAFAVPRAYSAKQFLATGWPFTALVVAWTLTDAVTPVDREGDAAGRPGDLRTYAVGAAWPLTIAIGISIIVAILTVATPRSDWRGAVAFLNQRSERTAAVWLDPSWNITPYEFYHPALTAETNGLQSAEATGMSFTKNRDVCLVAERFGTTPPTSASEAWLDAHLTLVDVARLARLEVRCYSNRSNP